MSTNNKATMSTTKSSLTAAQERQIYEEITSQNKRVNTKLDKYCEVAAAKNFYQDNLSDIDKYTDNAVNGRLLLDKCTFDVLENNCKKQIDNIVHKNVFLNFLKKYHIECIDVWQNEFGADAWPTDQQLADYVVENYTL